MLLAHVEGLAAASKRLAAASPRPASVKVPAMPGRLINKKIEKGVPYEPATATESAVSAASSLPEVLGVLRLGRPGAAGGWGLLSVAGFGP